MPTPTRVGATSGSSGAGTGANRNVTLPTGLAVGDVLVAHISATGGTGLTVTPPTGWTLVARRDAGTLLSLLVYRRIVDGTEPATVTFTFNVSQRSAYSCGAYRSTGGTVDVEADQAGVNAAPSVTAAAAELVLRFSTPRSTTATVNATMTWGSPAAEVTDVGNTSTPFVGSSMAEEFTSAGGATAAATVTSSVALTDHLTATVAITAAAAFVDAPTLDVAGASGLAAAGAADLTGATIDVASTSGLSGAGVLDVAGATVDVQGASGLAAAGAADLTGATVDVAAAAALAGAGAVDAGPALVDVASTSDFAATGVLLAGPALLDASAVAVLTAAGVLDVASSAIDVAASVDLDFASTVGRSGPPLPAGHITRQAPGHLARGRAGHITPAPAGKIT
jgi:hypothetical protein